MLLRDWLTTPRIQVPLAATAFMLVVATSTLVATVGEVSPESVPLALAVVAPLAFLINQSLFVRARTPRSAYLRALLLPPILAVVVGSGVLFWMLARHPDAEYSFGGPPIFDVGAAFPLFVAAGCFLLGGVVSAFLLLEVWLVARNPDRSWTPVWAWSGVALACMAAIRWVPGLGIAVGGTTAIAALLLALHAIRSARPVESIDRGPYRSIGAR